MLREQIVEQLRDYKQGICLRQVDDRCNDEGCDENEEVYCAADVIIAKVKADPEIAAGLKLLDMIPPNNERLCGNCPLDVGMGRCAITGIMLCDEGNGSIKDNKSCPRPYTEEVK